MKIIKSFPVESCAAEVAQCLEEPGSVALVPTETVYGLVAKVGDEAAFQKIFELKQRSAAKVLGWFVADWRTLKDYGVKLEGLPEKVAEKYFPGAVTVIAPAEEGSTLGFRSPDHPLLREILKLTGPLYQTSANLSGQPDPLDAESALKELSGEPAIAVDGGRLPEGAQGSTVVDCSKETLVVLRQGKVVVEL